MVTDYLIKKKEELIERKSQVESLLNALNATIREDSRMAELLESENKPAFSDFSPRSNRNNAKVSELQSQIEENLEKATRMQIKMSDLDDQMEELDLVIKEARELEKKIRDLETAAESVDDGGTDIVIEEDSDGQMSFEEPSGKEEKSEEPEKTQDFIIEELENIQKYLPSDPFRTKIELLQLIKKLK